MGICIVEADHCLLSCLAILGSGRSQAGSGATFMNEDVKRYSAAASVCLRGRVRMRSQQKA